MFDLVFILGSDLVRFGLFWGLAIVRMYDGGIELVRLVFVFGEWGNC